MSWLEDKILGFFVKTKGIFSSPLVGGKGLIFMLHRVLPSELRDVYSLNKDLAITPDKLEEFIVFFKQRNYVFISLDQLSDWFENKMIIPQKFICLTFDDGYQDNLAYGLPILKKHNVPATIYITNCFPNGNAIMWWYLVEDFFKKHTKLEFDFSAGVKTFSWESEEEAHAQFAEISSTIKSIPFPELTLVLSKAFHKDLTELTAQVKKEALTWEEIRMLSQEPLITIGAHTMNHVGVKQQKSEIVEEQMQASKNEIEQVIGKKVVHFAYPYGGVMDVDKKDVAIAQKVGFKTATLNQPGSIFKSNAKSHCALARMPLGNRIDEERMKNYLNGIYHFSVNGFTKNLY